MEPDELAALIRDTITNTITEILDKPSRPTDTPGLEERAANAEREYQRLCTAYETLYAKHAALKQHVEQLEGTPK